MINLYIIGAGQLGKVLYRELKKSKNYKVLGFIDKNFNGKTLYGTRVYKNENDFIKKKSRMNFVIALGDIRLRNLIIKKFSKKNFFFPKIIFKNCFIENINNISEGTIIMSHTKILNNTKIDNYTIIGTNVTILHDVKIGKNCVIGGNTCVGANTKIEENVLVGVGSVFSSSKKIIKKNSIICSGTVVHKNIRNNSKVIGNPFKYIPFKK